MTSTVLAYIPSPAQGVWHLGLFPVRAYALCIIAGIIAAMVLGDRRWVARGGEPGVIYDIALWAVPFGLVGGRLYHVITDWGTYFGSDGAGFVAALRIWDGGLGIWGAVALGGIGAWIACRRRGIPLPAFGDAIAPGIVLAQAIGRLGNYFNQELFGRETTLPWGLEIYERVNSAGVPDSLNGVSTGELIQVVHPTFLYEMVWNLLVFAMLIVLDRRFRIGHGRLFAMYVAGYCVGRFWIELMRSDFATQIAGIRVNSFTSTFVFIGAVVYIMAAPKGREDPASLRGQQSSEDVVAEEIVKEFTAAASTTGVVAAATVAAQEDEQSVAEAAEAEHFDIEAEDAPVGGKGEPGAVEQIESGIDGLGSVEGDEVAEAVVDAAVAHEVAVEGEASAEELTADAADDAEAAEAAEADADAEAVAEVDESPEGEPGAVEQIESGIDGLGSVEGDEVAEAVVDAAVAHEVAVEGEASAEELTADAADDAEAAEAAEADADAEAVAEVDESPEGEPGAVEQIESGIDGLGSVEGDEVAEAVVDAAVAHEVAVEGEASAEELTADAAEGDAAEADAVEQTDTATEAAAAGESSGSEVSFASAPSESRSRAAALKPVGERVQRWLRQRRIR